MGSELNFLRQLPYRRNTMATVSITSNEGKLSSASAVLEVSATNREYNQPALRIKQAGEHGGAASIRIDDPNPDIEFVETDQVAPAGKYEVAVQSDKLQINGRNAANDDFDTIVVFQRRLRVAISASDSKKPKTSKSLEEDGVSSRLLMLPPRR